MTIEDALKVSLLFVAGAAPLVVGRDLDDTRKLELERSNELELNCYGDHRSSELSGVSCEAAMIYDDYFPIWEALAVSLP